MNIKDFREYVDSLCSHVLFDYNDKPCGVDPINRQLFYIWCGEGCAEAKNLDEVFELPIFDGKSLIQIYDKIENMDW